MRFEPSSPLYPGLRVLDEQDMLVRMGKARGVWCYDPRSTTDVSPNEQARQTCGTKELKLVEYSRDLPNVNPTIFGEVNHSLSRSLEMGCSRQVSSVRSILDWSAAKMQATITAVPLYDMIPVQLSTNVSGARRPSQLPFTQSQLAWLFVLTLVQP